MTSATVRVEKATSDLLIGPDWTLNMDICDSINSDHWQAKDVVKAVKKRLQHKNPRVQFLALTLLETMIKNCGDYIHSQVVERDILQEMNKIVKKKTDIQVRDKILVLLDSWQEAFGGPGGKYPQYYWAFAELRQSGVQFPQRSAESSLIFTPVTHPTLVHGHPQAGYGMPSNSSLRLDEAMASEMANLSLSDLDTIQSVMDLLSDMLKAIGPNDHGAVKDDIITDLVSQCRSNQKKLVQMLNTTGDEELLGQGLALNDILQSLLTKHDAIASGSPLPAETVETLPGPSTPVSSALVVTNRIEDEEEEEDDEFAQLARRNSKVKPATQSTSAGGGVHPASPNHSDATTATDVTSSAEASSYVSSTALALPDPPAPVKTISKESEMIDLLSITLSTNPSPPRTPVAPPTISDQNASPESVTPNKQGHPYNPQPYAVNQGYIPYNNYVAPWAQPQPQPQVPQFSSSYPPPPWEATASTNPNPYMSTTYRFPGSSVNYSAAPAATPANPAYVPMRVPGPPHQYNNSFGFRGNTTATTLGETHINASPRQPAPTTATRPFVPSYRLFEDLIDLRNADGSVKTSNSTPKLSGTSNQGMIGGRK